MANLWEPVNTPGLVGPLRGATCFNRNESSFIIFGGTSSSSQLEGSIEGGCSSKLHIFDANMKSCSVSVFKGLAPPSLAYSAVAFEDNRALFLGGISKGDVSSISYAFNSGKFFFCQK